MGLTPCGMLLPTLVRNLEPSQGGPIPAKTPQQQPDDLSNPYGYSEMDWAAQLDPAYAAARAEVRRLSVGEDGALSVKVKECVVLGVLAVWSKNSNAPFSQSLRAHLRSLYLLHPIWLCPILTTTEGQRL